MKKTLILDTNVLLRYLTNDVPAKADDVEKLFKDAQSGVVKLFVSDICVAELVWTLQSFYKLQKSDIASKVTAIINTPGFYFSDERMLLDAIRRFSEKNVDFIDAYNAALASKLKMKISSYDDDYRKFPDVSALEPPDYD